MRPSSSVFSPVRIHRETLRGLRNLVGSARDVVGGTSDKNLIDDKRLIAIRGRLEFSRLLYRELPHIRDQPTGKEQVFAVANFYSVDRARTEARSERRRLFEMHFSRTDGRRSRDARFRSAPVRKHPFANTQTFRRFIAPLMAPRET